MKSQNVTHIRTETIGMNMCKKLPKKKKKMVVAVSKRPYKQSVLEFADQLPIDFLVGLAKSQTPKPLLNRDHSQNLKESHSPATFKDL